MGRFLRRPRSIRQVVSIKLTLYRTGRNSPVVEALLEALRHGKEVSVFVELKARFDEESNIAWTHRLTAAGGHVVYGVVGFKTHAKTALVVRREGEGLRRYTHIGSGNYNAGTARVYTDLGLLSADPDLGADLNDFFNELTGSSGPAGQGLPTPLGRTSYARAGDQAPHRTGDGARPRGAAGAHPGEAQWAHRPEGGTRPVPCFRGRASMSISSCGPSARCGPASPGSPSRIRIHSILGRFLEHARIYYFHNAGQDEYFMGSADWRSRNLRKRVEVVAPVDDRGGSPPTPGHPRRGAGRSPRLGAASRRLLGTAGRVGTDGSGAIPLRADEPDR